MATARSIYQPANWSQRNQRANSMFQDQYGRKYFGSIELKTGDVVGLMEPQFQAPLMPEQKYLERVEGRPYDLYWNLKRLRADIQGGWKDWNNEGRQMMRKMRGKAYNPNEEFGEDVLDIIGEPPQPIEPVIAAQQGNRWVLGLTKKVDERLAKYFDLDKVLEEEERAERDPDFRDPKVERAERQEVRGRVPVRSNRRQARQTTKGTGARKGHPPRAPEAPAKRDRYPKGHPRAGQFIPLERVG